MGSDMYMEAQNFRPRPNKAEWELVNDNLELVIYQDVFYHGYKMLWHGDVNSSNESLILSLVSKIPPKPRYKSRREQVYNLLSRNGVTQNTQWLTNEVMKILETPEP